MTGGYLETPHGLNDATMLMAIIERASQAESFDLDRLEKLLELKERWDKAAAVRAYAVAKVAFKADPPTLFKNKHVGFNQTAYNHATHDEVTLKISEALARHGFSHSWSIAQTDDSITVTCTLLHCAGHSEAVGMTAAHDKSGGKNLIQAVASANTYMQRYTLLAITGLSTADIPDDDGRAWSNTRTEETAPAVDQAVWDDLRRAARDGTKSLALAWAELPNDTRKVIVTYYGKDWEKLKLEGAGK